MTHKIESVAILSSSPGTQRTVKVHRIGNVGARPKAYFQAALHANETPGLLIGHHLLDLALAADRTGRFKGELVIVPFANPIGLSDNVLGNQIGRESLDGGGNYNRGWPSLSSGLAARVEGKLGADAEANKAVSRCIERDARRAAARQRGAVASDHVAETRGRCGFCRRLAFGTGCYRRDGGGAVVRDDA